MFVGVIESSHGNISFINFISIARLRANFTHNYPILIGDPYMIPFFIWPSVDPNTCAMGKIYRGSHPVKR